MTYEQLKETCEILVRNGFGDDHVGGAAHDEIFGPSLNDSNWERMPAADKERLMALGWAVKHRLINMIPCLVMGTITTAMIVKEGHFGMILMSLFGTFLAGVATIEDKNE